MLVAKNNCVDLTLRIGNMSDTPRTDWLNADYREAAIANLWATAEDRITELERENAELRKDAERYRWLKDSPWDEDLTRVIQFHLNAKFDTAIDAAMEKKP
jgi:hypothetical protein